MSNLLTKFKLAPPSPPPLEVNPIMEFFDVGKETSSAGPELVWKVHDALRKSDGKECSVFFFDKRIPERLYKLKRKDVVLDRIRGCIILLEKMRHPKMLQIIHTLEEGNHTFAFATEPVLASLHNILAWHDSVPVPADVAAPLMPMPVSLDCEERAVYIPSDRPPDAKQYYFLDFELRYGLLQIIEALHFLHYKARQIHRNVCPHVIIVTKRGTWKLFGLEFVEDILGSDPTEMKAVTPWSVKLAMITQPNLDFMAPETQASGHVNILSDMFSLGLVICAIFNNGKYLLQCQNNQLLYLKQIQYLNQQVEELQVRIPAALQEAVGRMLSLDPHPRPTTQLLPLIKYFKFQIEVAIQAMQFLDEIAMKDRDTKSEFYRVTLITALPVIPKKLRWQHIWPAINNEVRTGEVVAALITPITWFANDSTSEEFHEYIMPTLRKVIGGPKTILASVELLDNLHIILKKCNREHINKDILPFLYHTMDSNTNQLQNASLTAAAAVSEFINDEMLLGRTLTKVNSILEKNMSDVRVIKLTVTFFEKILHRLDRTLVLDHVVPTLLSMRLTDPGVVDKVVCLYRSMLAEPRFGLTSNVMATKLLPSLAPQTVNPSLSADQFNHLMEIMYDMLDSIDKSQRAKLKLEARRLQHQASTDNMVVQPFSIPNLRVAAQRKTSSAEDMARKNSVGAPQIIGTGSVGGFKGTGIGQWFFGSNNSTTDNNFLRVASIIPSRRLSDNTLMTPKIRVAPSCASSPGGTSGSASGLPTRRHSSIGPQERRGSAVNLSPPTGYRYRAGSRGGSGSSLSVPAGSQGALARSMMIGGSMPNTSSSVPYLLTSSTGSVRSRRPSVALSGSQGSGLLSQISSGVSRHLPGGGGGGGAPQQHLPSRAGTPKHVQAPWQALQGATAASYTALQNTAMAVKKCPSLNITLPR